jgi:predicted Zn-dependent protease
MKQIQYIQILLLSMVCFFFNACTTNSITGRRQLSLYPESALQTQAVSAYRSFIDQNKIKIPVEGSDAAMVKRVGNRISEAIKQYYGSKGMSKELDGYVWEFNLVEKNEVNAWCMPGGKVVVYTGLLPVTQNETALAIVLGHEITHAVAHHGNERMSQLSIAQGIQIAGDVFTRDQERANFIFNNVFAPSAQVGFLLPNSRKQEYEADRYGLIFAAMAGYDPRESVEFWKRMANKGGQKPPEFLATHPSDENRIKQLQKYMDEALKYYNK